MRKSVDKLPLLGSRNQAFLVTEAFRQRGIVEQVRLSCLHASRSRMRCAYICERTYHGAMTALKKWGQARPRESSSQSALSQSLFPASLAMPGRRSRADLLACITARLQ